MNTWRNHVLQMVNFPESVSEGSFLNLGHHYLAFTSWPPLLGLQLFGLRIFAFSFSSISLLSPFWTLGVLGCSSRGFVAKMIVINMVWRTCVPQMVVFIMPASGLIQTEQFLIWFGDLMFSK